MPTALSDEIPPTALAEQNSLYTHFLLLVF